MEPGVRKWQKCKLFIFSLAVPCVLSSTWGLLRSCLSSSSRQLTSHGSLAQQAALRRGSQAWMRGGLETWRPSESGGLTGLFFPLVPKYLYLLLVSGWHNPPRLTYHKRGSNPGQTNQPCCRILSHPLLSLLLLVFLFLPTPIYLSACPISPDSNPNPPHPCLAFLPSPGLW